MYEYVKDTDIQIVEIDGKRYALNGWNGLKYYDAYEVYDIGYAVNYKAPKIIITPIQKQVAEDEWEIIGYGID